MDGPVRSLTMNIVERKALASNLYRVTVAASEKARQPPDLNFAGLSTENYIRNPVVMWAHDTVGRSPSGGLPIGRTLKLTKTPEGRLVADFEFLEEDAFAQRVKNAWDKGFLKSASISWIPLESVPIEGGRWRDVRSELLEWSIVSVPADPDALREAHRRMLDDFLGVEGHDSVSDEMQVQVRADDAGHPNELRLAPEGFDDLSRALTLLRDVVEGLQQPNMLEDVDALSAAELSDLRVLIGDIKRTVRST